MKINNFLIKISNKLNEFFKKHFGRASEFRIVTIFIMSLFSAIFFYYYISDLNVPKILAFIISTLIFCGIFCIVFLFKIYFYFNKEN